MKYLKRDMNKEQLEIAMAMLDAHAEERRRQHAEINHSLDRAIKSVKVQLWIWAAVIVCSTAVIVETAFNLIN
jgi:hypothetical protein